jgi:hypothetical protein
MQTLYCTRPTSLVEQIQSQRQTCCHICFRSLLLWLGLACANPTLRRENLYGFPLQKFISTGHTLYTMSNLITDGPQHMHSSQLPNQLLPQRATANPSRKEQRSLLHSTRRNRGINDLADKNAVTEPHQINSPACHKIIQTYKSLLLLLMLLLHLLFLFLLRQDHNPTRTECAYRMP